MYQGTESFTETSITIPVETALCKNKTNTKLFMAYRAKLTISFHLYAFLLPGEQCLGFWGPV